MKIKNTLQKGSVRYIVFREEGIWYAVNLEFNIVESGDNPMEVLAMLFEATEGYLESAKKIKARPHILNQKTDKQYEDLWNILEKGGQQKEKTKMPWVFAFGQMPLAVAA